MDRNGKLARKRLNLNGKDGRPMDTQRRPFADSRRGGHVTGRYRERARDRSERGIASATTGVDAARAGRHGDRRGGVQRHTAMPPGRAASPSRHHRPRARSVVAPVAGAHVRARPARRRSVRLAAEERGDVEVAVAAEVGHRRLRGRGARLDAARRLAQAAGEARHGRRCVSIGRPSFPFRFSRLRANFPFRSIPMAC